MFVSYRSRTGFVGALLSAFILAVGLTGYNVKLGGTDVETGSDFGAAPDGAEIYMTRCMSCHQMNGGGVPGVFPPVADSEWVTEDKGQLIRIVLNGMTGEVLVKGEKYSGAMPPWGSFLSDAETADLLTYMRTAWGNEASEVTPEEVRKVREAVKDRKEPWTAEELQDPANKGIPGEEGAENG